MQRYWDGDTMIGQLELKTKGNFSDSWLLYKCAFNTKNNVLTVKMDGKVVWEKRVVKAVALELSPNRRVGRFDVSTSGSLESGRVHTEASVEAFAAPSVSMMNEWIALMNAKAAAPSDSRPALLPASQSLPPPSPSNHEVLAREIERRKAADLTRSRSLESPDFAPQEKDAGGLAEEEAAAEFRAMTGAAESAAAALRSLSFEGVAKGAASSFDGAVDGVPGAANAALAALSLALSPPTSPSSPEGGATQEPAWSAEEAAGAVASSPGERGGGGQSPSGALVLQRSTSSGSPSSFVSRGADESPASPASGGGGCVGSAVGGVGSEETASKGAAVSEEDARALAAEKRCFGNPDSAPPRYIEGLKGDMAEATRRWASTCAWRSGEAVEGVCEEAMPCYPLIRKHYSHFFHGHGRSGSVALYFRLGLSTFSDLFAASVPAGKADAGKGAAASAGPGRLVTEDDVVRHHVFMLECLFKHWGTIVEKKVGEQDTTYKMQRLVAVFDMQGLSFGLARKIFGVVKRVIQILEQHYVGRLDRICIINAPSFKLIMTMINPLIPVEVRAKIRVCGNEYVDELKEVLVVSEMPRQYGGTCDVPLGEWVLERHINAMYAHPQRLFVPALKPGEVLYVPTEAEKFNYLVPPTKK